MSDTEESSETVIRYDENEINDLYKSICVVSNKCSKIVLFTKLLGFEL